MSRINVANFRHPDGTSDNINLDSSGRVGVGTASPGAPLAIQANSTAEGIEILGRATDGIGEFAFFENDGTTEIGRIQARTTELQLRARQSGQSIVFAAGGITESARIDSSGNLKFNSGYGSVATAYGCRAWINFDGTSGSIGTGRASGNISSVTDNGTGNYTVNFATAMPDANFAAVISVDGLPEFDPTVYIFTTSSFSIVIYDAGAYRDRSIVCAAVFR